MPAGTPTAANRGFTREDCGCAIRTGDRSGGRGGGRPAHRLRRRLRVEAAEPERADGDRRRDTGRGPGHLPAALRHRQGREGRRLERGGRPRTGEGGRRARRRDRGGRQADQAQLAVRAEPRRAGDLHVPHRRGGRGGAHRGDREAAGPLARHARRATVRGRGSGPARELHAPSHQHEARRSAGHHRERQRLLGPPRARRRRGRVPARRHRGPRNRFACPGRAAHHRLAKALAGQLP